MKTQLEFRSTAFPPFPDEDQQINPGLYGKRLADFLAAELPSHGFEVICVDAEDWGWRVEVRNEAYPLWIGCANYQETEEGFLCFIEPSKPVIRHWFKKIETEPRVESLGLALEAILLGSGKVSAFRWWTDDEVQP